MKFLRIYGSHKAGKTNLASRLIVDLTAEGFRCAAWKNIHHEDFSIETPGTDTHRLAESGAVPVVAYSPGETAIIFNRKLDFEQVVSHLENLSGSSKVDLVIIEGGIGDDIPSVKVPGEEDKLTRPGTLLEFDGSNYEQVLSLAKKILARAGDQEKDK
jgi:molybdopterin-guanine dinucleotide biosynthesis protein B